MMVFQHCKWACRFLLFDF